MTTQSRIGDCIQTYTGKQFWPMDPRPEDIDIEDIAHALANICRFGGHCHTWYSVAQHSVLVSEIAKDCKAGLLHDAAEAYIGDMVRPLKRYMTSFTITERNLQYAIFRRFNVELNDDNYKEADEIVLATECRDVMREGPQWGKLTARPMNDRIRPWSSRYAYSVFMDRAKAEGLV